MGISIVVYILIAILTLVYLYINKAYSYWKDRNVVHIEPTFLYGNLKDVLKSKVHLTEVIGNIYNKIKTEGKKFGGIYALFSPQFLPVDLDLVKSILHQDFASFANHGLYVDEEKEPLTGHLFNLEDEKWRNLRAKLTPTFTSGKMKMMFQTIVDCTEGLQEALNKLSTSDDPIDIKDVLGCFTTDVIGSVAFGLEINSLKNPDSDFRKYGKKVFMGSFRSNIIYTILSILPKWLSNRLSIKISEHDVESFYMNLVKDTVAYREQNNVYRKDFLHLLIQLKNHGKITDDESFIQKSNNSVQGLTLNEMVAQCFVFFIAGFETSATTMTFALLELSQRPDIQEKVREDIKNVLSKHGNKITYDSIAEMEYLEKVVLETLRKHPPVGVLPRICTKQYQVPDSDLVIDVGTRVSIPVLSIHRDPEHYPEPNVFDPERFSEENKNSRHPFAYLPFGEGPRTCIGLRFGKLQAKVGLCCILNNYKVTLNDKTQFPITYETGFVSSVKGGVWVNLKPL